MSMRWDILYRGPLSSCNYECGYCPFAKTRNTAEELRDDAEHLMRFVAWVNDQTHREIGVLFTPWGEALNHRSYQEALETLSMMPHVYRAAIQTNLSCHLDWIDRCDLDTLALWTTYHPTQVTRKRFLEKCRELDRRRCRYSVGMVGLKEAFDEIRAVRAALDSGTYLWINALKHDPEYYDDEDMAELDSIDPYFRFNAVSHPSRGRTCRTGSASFSVDGEGNARRCHFVSTPLGNIYDPDFKAGPEPSPCPIDTCHCHIGYVYLEHLALQQVFGDGLLERIPQ